LTGCVLAAGVAAQLYCGTSWPDSWTVRPGQVQCKQRFGNAACGICASERTAVAAIALLQLPCVAASHRQRQA